MPCATVYIPNVILALMQTEADTSALNSFDVLSITKIFSTIEEVLAIISIIYWIVAWFRFIIF